MSEPFHRERHIEGAYHVNPIFMTVDAVRMAQPTQMYATLYSRGCGASHDTSHIAGYIADAAMNIISTKKTKVVHIHKTTRVRPPRLT